MSGITTSRFFDFLDRLKEWQLFLGLFAYAFFIRFPFFFRDYIDRDESTFILMGQSWVEGNLPYTELWDLKPPITFLFFTTIIYLFGKSFLAIRVAGTLLVAISAFYTYKITESQSGKNSGILSALLVIILFSLFGSLQGVMSEHICMAFFIPGVYLFLRNKNKFDLVFSGLLFGLAIMSKLNIGYPVVFIFLLTLWQAFKNGNFLKRFIDLLLCGLSICFVAFFTFLPYLMANQPYIWWDSVIRAPLAYSNAEGNSILGVLPMVLLFTAFFVVLWKYCLDKKSNKIKSLLFISLGILFSFVQAGKANGHYLIQLYPFFIILVVSAFSGSHVFKTRAFLMALPLFLFLLPIESYIEISKVVKNKNQKGTFYNGEGISVPQYFTENGLSTRNILFFEYHIGYWLLEINPLTKPATHPSNLLREDLFPYMENTRKTEHEELKYVLESLKPEYIITRKNRRIFHYEKYAANFYAQLQLLKNYTVLDTVENAVIHQRLPRQ